MSRVEGKEQPYTTIPTLSYVLRRVVSFTSSPILTRKVIDLSTEGFSRAKQLAKEGYGNVFIITHPGQGEIPRFLAALGEDPIFGQREIAVPESVEHYKDWHDSKGRWANITAFPITTEASLAYFAKPPQDGDEKEKARYERKKTYYEQLLLGASKEYIIQHPEKEKLYGPRPMKTGQRALLENCLNGEAQTLAKGGIVIIYVQGSRHPYLGTITRAISMLIDKTNKAGINRYALTTVGVGIRDKKGRDIEDYEDPKVAGYNLRRTYLFLMGETNTCIEYQKEAQERELTLDQLTLKKLGLVIPPAYRPPKLVLP